MSDWPLALQAPDVKIRREMLCGNFLLEAWRKANLLGCFRHQVSHFYNRNDLVNRPD